MRESASQQLSFVDLDDVGEDFADAALFDTTLVVVDLETTGSDPSADRITEIGAVKIRGGEVIGEFATLVDPGRTIPPQIVTLTGITEAMVSDAPRIPEVLASFIEFARGSILVAHNARFDMSFLRQNAARLQLPWPFTATLCTVTMARRILSRDEAPTVRLSALAELFDVSVHPTHRALDDARATVEVFHHLLERVGNQGITSFRELTAYLPRRDPQVYAKRRLAADVPASPGVYLFRGPGDEVLYIGTAVDLRRRVLSYFTGGDPRRRMGEMVRLASRVDHVVCAHALEAGVRELRLLAAHAPAYNRRSTQPNRGWWIELSAERFPRLRVRRTAGDGTLGPIANRADAATVADAIAAVAGLRTCTARLGGRTSHHWCRADTADGHVVGGCHAASERPITATEYASRVAAVRALMSGESDDLLQHIAARMHTLADAEMFESAARQRDRLVAVVDALSRCQRLDALCRIEEIVVAAPSGDGGWELAVIRHGRLASAGLARRGVAPMSVVQALLASAQTVVPDPGPLRGAPAEEVALLYRWITTPGARIVAAAEPLMMPARSAQRWTDFATDAREARSAVHVDRPQADPPAPIRAGPRSRPAAQSSGAALRWGA